MAHHPDIDFRMVAGIGATFASLAQPFLDQLSTGLNEGAAQAQLSLVLTRGALRGLTFELSGRQRHGALDSKRKMGRRPSA